MNLKKRENGVWYIYNSRVERRLLGLPQAVSLKTSDESVALAKFQMLKGQRRDSQIKSINKVEQIKLSEFITEYLPARELQGLSDGTIEIDSNALSKFKEIIGDMTLRRIGREQVDRFKLTLLRKNLSQTYINIMLRSLSAAFSYALTLEKPYLSVNPFVKRHRGDRVQFKLDDKLPRYLHPDEKDKIINALNREIVLVSDQDGFWHIDNGAKRKPLLTKDRVKAEGFLAEDRKRKKDLRTAVYIYLYTGIRRAELVSLNWQDIDFANGFIHVHHTKGKRDRLIPISENLVPFLKSILGIDGEVVISGIGPLFPNWTSPATLSRLFREMAAKPAGVQATLHSLRHTFATSLLMEGEDLKRIKELLGHRSSVTTELYARFINTEVLRKTVNKLKF